MAAAPAVAPHGSHRLPAVYVDSYNVELKDDEGFIGDRASKGRVSQHDRPYQEDLAQVRR